jgi:hypothetical protein
MTEISLGLTFLDVAATTHNAETRDRNRENARKAHDTAVKFLEEDKWMTPAQREAMETSLAKLTSALDRSSGTG